MYTHFLKLGFLRGFVLMSFLGLTVQGLRGELCPVISTYDADGVEKLTLS